MTSSTGNPPSPGLNPFSPMAVARVTRFSDSGWADLTIETSAVTQATAWLDGYLAAEPGSEEERDGEVIALVGDYGTGKTHLAYHLVQRARRVLNDSARVMYVDVTAGSFVELYRRFMHMLGRDGVREQVNDYYADVVADSLLSLGLGDELVRWLRDRELVPSDVVDQLGLMESQLLRKVQERLRRVTKNTDFGTALTLLLRTGFDDVVWDWLIGGEPASVLVERGVTKPIDTESAALEAMGVFAHLYGGRNTRFVLVLDELDKLLPGPGLSGGDAGPAFDKLLEVFANAGACLVVCALPEAQGLLRPSTRQRLSRVVEMVRLSSDEVSLFITRAQEAATGRAGLAPFTPESVRYLRDVAGGNARKVIRLCHDAYRIVEDRRRETNDPDVMVDDQIVREAENNQVAATLGREDIRLALRRIILAHGWGFEQDRLLRQDKADTRTDFWITFDDRRGGVAILVTESVHDAPAGQDLLARIAAVRNATPEARLVLVVTGTLAADQEHTIKETLDADPVFSVEYGYADTVASLVQVVGDELERVTELDPVTVFRHRLDQLGRQQSSFYEQLDEIADRVDNARGSTARRLAAIQQELSLLTRNVRATTAVDRPEVGLPGEVDQLLLTAVEALDELTSITPMMTEAFADTDAIDLMTRRLEKHLFEAFGMASLIRATVLAFRGAVAGWYSSEVVGAPHRLSQVARQRLDRLCERYDLIMERLPLFRLWPLLRVRWTAGADSEASRASLQERVESAVRNLSPKVQRALEQAGLPAGE